MDFDTTIGSFAQIAKHLELRWFYSLESDGGVHTSSSASSKGDGASDGDGTLRLEGKYVRRRYPAMPFLRRNVRRGLSKQSSRGNRGTTVKQRASLPDIDVLSQLFGPSSAMRPCRESRKRKHHQSNDKRPNNNVTAAKNDNIINGVKDDSPTVQMKNGIHHAKAKATAITHQSKHSPCKVISAPSPYMLAYQLFMQSSYVRRLIIEQLPQQLHHDDTLILERKRGMWMSMTSSQSKQSARAVDDTSVTNHAYWVGMEEKDKDRFDKEQLQYESAMKKRQMLFPPSIMNNEPAKQQRLSTYQAASRNQNTVPTAYFHFIYMQDNNVPATVVEKMHDRHCPFCSFTGKNDNNLLRHLDMFHGELVDPRCNIETNVGESGLCFEAILDEEEQLHVIVRGNPEISLSERGNFVFIRTSTNATKHSFGVSFLQRSHHKTALLDSTTRRRRLLALQAKDASASAISAYLASDTMPIRQYYHPRSNQPLTSKDWEYDSDGEPDDEWLDKLSSDLMAEFEDVSDKEKELFIIWNRFIRRHHTIADSSIPDSCEEFVMRHKFQLKEGEMRQTLLLHLMNLWDSGLISPSRTLKCMTIFDEE